MGDALRDQTSSGHPYGNLIVDPLLNELGILHASPRLFALSPSVTLGDFNPQFGGLLGTLEISPKGEKKDREGTFGANDVLKSYELFRERFDDQEVLIDQREFLRARLFDLLIGDWSRHEDNWKWARYGTSGDVDEVERIRPIPRDRDNAFSRLDGLIPWAASRRWAVPNLENFGFRPPDVRSLTYQARHMDRLLLSPLPREAYITEAKRIQSQLSDDVLAAAVSQIPAPASAQNQGGADAGAEKTGKYRAEQQTLLAKLKRRRDDLVTYAEKYYELHAETVDVVGTNDEEAFRLEANRDGTLRITSTDVKGKSAGKILYDRTFAPSETNEVRLYGLGDDDRFETVGPVGKRIRVRIVGGDGEDEYLDAGGQAGRVRVYDNTSAGNSERSGLNFRQDWRRELYYYDRTAFKYNKTAPVVSLGFNSYSGVQGKIGFTHERTNFARRDFSKRYTFFVEGGALGNFAAEGRAEFGQVIRYADIVVSSRVGRPDFYNFFFGLGNNSVLDQSNDRNTFNLVSLNHFDTQLGLRRRYAEDSYFNVWFGYQNNKTTDTENTILDREDRFYGDGDLVFGFINPEFVFDLRDHPVFPSKGVMLEASHKQAYGRRDAVDFSVSKVAAEIHVSTRRFPISLSFRTGWATSRGRAPFYELPTLGRDNGLRGFQRNRFTGSGYFFYNTEFRMPVALIRSRVVPFALGIRAFFDRGRIIQNDDGDNSMKSAYGGGLYLIPASKSYTLSALVGWSDEESALIRAGVGTNF